MEDMARLFQDMALLVDQQGEMLDQIEFHVRASAYQRMPARAST